MSEDRRRLEAAAAEPAILRLWLALQPLRSTVRVLQTGAHPDDETTALLVRLARKDGAAVAYVCAVRGEGGQNAIGTERGAELGALRTREMELAARRVPMRLYWLNEEIDGPIHDFGLSKRPEEALEVWGRERTLERLVRVIRHFRPDILLPTFLDVDGQHGHHRAITRLTVEAFDAAGDPAAFPDQGLLPWHPAKLYLPAWSGAGGTYDDSEPPPEATVAVEVGERDPITGLTYDQLGQWSRAAHACQGMGRWLESTERQVPLHLLRCRLNHPLMEAHPFDGLPVTLGDWAGSCENTRLAVALGEAQQAIDAALDAFPSESRVLAMLDRLRPALAAAETLATADLRDRLGQKLAEADRAAVLASGISVSLRAATRELRPWSTVRLAWRLHHGGRHSAERVALEIGGQAIEHRLDPGDSVAGEIGVPTAGHLFHPYGFVTDPGLDDNPVAARLRIGREGTPIDVAAPLEAPLAVLPAEEARLQPGKAIVNLERPLRHLGVALEATGEVTWGLPDGWSTAPGRIVLPPDPPPGRYRLQPLVDRVPARAVSRIAHPHIAPTWLVRPAALDVLVTAIRLPEPCRIGYVGAGTDHTSHWLAAIGLEVVEIDDTALERAAFDGLDTLVIAVMAFGRRPALRVAAPALHVWVEAGGNLVTQYQRPWDGWDPAATPPRFLEIGQPSLRWRVTDPAAPVTVLAPDHPVLTHPNRITATDWEGWVKERGLYFARRWDPAYRPLLAMADRDEPLLEGGLVSARIGRGRHSHVALNLFHQMDNLVPGAMRLMANLVAPAD
jgi:LmbE family N-acetylglucosaminyl deacetylase